jgi:cell division septal protein FtsQ
MDEKIRDRRRSINRRRGWRRISIVFPVLVLLCAGGLFLWLRSTDVFAVRTITATVTERVTAEEITGAAAEATGESLLRISTGAVEEALLELPYVRSVDVHRRFPDGLDIELTEYEPVARVRWESGEMWLVSDTGRLLEQPDLSDLDPYSDLPLIVAAASFAPVPGKQVPDTVADALPIVPLLGSAKVGGRLPAVERVAISAAGYVTACLAGDVELRLGDPSELEQKLTVAMDILQQCSRDGVVLEYVDATVPDRVAVKAK